MRRKDREVTDKNKILEIIDECLICRLGLIDKDEVYIVPLNFGASTIDGVTTLYFHSAKVGRKILLLETNKKVGFEMDTAYVLTVGNSDIACECSGAFKSIIGQGNVSMVTNENEKIEGLKILMQHMTKKQEWNFEQKMVDATAVFKVEITEMACKVHE